jgi:hypothetical protein
MKKKEEELNEKMKKIEGRTPRELRQLMNKIKVKISVLEGNIQNGQITEKMYFNILVNQFEHDKLLGQYFLQEGQNEKADIIAKRLNLIMNEIEELKSVMNE